MDLPKIFQADANRDKPEEGLSALEAVLAARKQTTSIPNPPQEKSPEIIVVNGFTLPVNEMTLLMFVLATELSKDPKIKHILDAFKLDRFHDLTGKQIYPPPVNNPPKKSYKKRARKTSYKK